MARDTVTITVDQHDRINILQGQISAMLHMGCVGGIGEMGREKASDYMTSIEDRFDELMAVVREIVDQGIKPELRAA